MAARTARRSRWPVSAAVLRFREELRRAEARYFAYEAVRRVRALEPNHPHCAAAQREACERSIELRSDAAMRR